MSAGTRPGRTAARTDALRRAVSGLDAWWQRAFVALVVGTVVLAPPAWVEALLVVGLLLLALSFVRPPRHTGEAVALPSPLRGRWVAVNSPGTRVPSHGVRVYGQDYAVDVLHPPNGTTRIGWGLGSRPETYSCWDEPVLAAVDARVARAVDGMRDHRARDTWPSLLWLMTGENVLRTLGGQRWVLGNHVVLDHGDGTFSVHAHLRRGTVAVREGDRVGAGDLLGRIGTTGNTSEPHLHWHLMDRADPARAAGVPWCWTDLRLTEEVTRRWGDGEARRGRRSALVPAEGVPPNGRVFELAGPGGGHRRDPAATS